MRKINSSGVTMIELLGTIVILGLLVGFAMVNYFSYRDRTAVKAYKMIPENVSAAADEYFMDHYNEAKVNSVVTIQTLVCDGYLEFTKDPFNKDKSCYGSAMITSIDKEAGKANVYHYGIHVICSGGREMCKLFPERTTTDAVCSTGDGTSQLKDGNIYCERD